MPKTLSEFVGSRRKQNRLELSDAAHNSGRVLGNLIYHPVNGSESDGDVIAVAIRIMQKDLDEIKAFYNFRE